MFATVFSLLPASSKASTELGQAPRQRIIGGELAKRCAFPSVASLQLKGGALCSATLVAPRLVFTAAHCLDISTPTHVGFGENASYPARQVEVESCKAHPHWKVVDNSVDMAYCLLTEEVRDIPITPILMGCEEQALTPRAEIYLAGFGDSKIDQQVGDPDFGLKRFVKTKLIQIIDDTHYPIAILGSAGKQGCNGDSGGPAFVRLPPERFGEQAGWRVFGVTHGPWGNTPDCSTGQGQYAMMHNWIGEIEEETGMDFTPCFDSDGSWNPGPKCHGAPLQLATTAQGQWPDQCIAGPRTQAIGSCAQTPKPEPEPEPEPEADTSSAGDATNPGASSSQGTSTGNAPDFVPKKSVTPDTTGPRLPGPARVKPVEPRPNEAPPRRVVRGCQLAAPSSLPLGGPLALLALLGRRRRPARRCRS